LRACGSSFGCRGGYFFGVGQYGGIVVVVLCKQRGNFA
jgi:hypothetical protein